MLRSFALISVIALGACASPPAPNYEQTVATPGAQPTAEGAADPAAVEVSGISQTNDFDAIREEETIESDAERRRRAAAQLVIDQPTAVPERANGVNLAEYALQSTHPVGTRMYRRSGGIGGGGCSRYASADAAQRAFLSNGGPTNDNQNLDRDGDGYACNWTPEPYQRMLTAN
ncbi:hypothetical protein ACMA5I_03750 [Paracoccaceae bacterium GXU_MW_L88]